MQRSSCIRMISTMRLRYKISKIEDPEWTRRYHSHDWKEQGFGARPFGRAEYIKKFKTRTEEIFDPAESDRFLYLVQRLPDRSAEEVRQLNPVASTGYLEESEANWIF